MLMTIGFSRCVYQDPLIHPLGLAFYEFFMNLRTFLRKTDE